MGKYRNRLQIIADILSIASSGAKKTQIMYGANLSYRLLCKYLSEVLNAELVSFENNDYYEITAKGRTFLSKYKDYSEGYERLKEHLGYVIDAKMVLEWMCPNTNMIENESSRHGEKKKASTKQHQVSKLRKELLRAA